MLIVGALVEVAANGTRPVDGGVAVWQDGDFQAVLPEERVTRRKYAGGFHASLDRALKIVGRPLSDVDALCLASYGETQPIAPDHVIAETPHLAPIRDRIVIAPSHHELHALYGLRHAGLHEALVVVLDNEGMILGPQTDRSTPFRNPMERATYYLGHEAGLDLLTRDFIGRADVSIGEAFRRFSYYCGFPSHQFAGKTMALAAYGDPGRFAGIDLIRATNAGPRVDLSGDYDAPGASVRSFFASHGHDVAPPRGPDEAFHSDHLDAAAFVQGRTEEFLVQRLGGLLEDTGMRQIVLAGGVAYNCRLVGTLERRLGVPVHVPPSPGDQGICVGAVHYVLERRGLRRHYSPTSYLGGSPGTRDGALLATVADRVRVLDRTQDGLVDYGGRSLQDGAILGLVEGRSECGRRALGHRSLIALPTPAAMEKLRLLKKREWFRPFGVSVLAGYVDQLFDAQDPDRFMLRATPLRTGAPEYAQRVAHVDGTLRAQLVPDDDDSLLGQLLRRLEESGNPPFVINTSFNLNGEPLVETVEEAVALCIGHAEIHALLVPDWGCIVENQARD